MWNCLEEDDISWIPSNTALCLKHDDGDDQDGDDAEQSDEARTRHALELLQAQMADLHRHMTVEAQQRKDQESRSKARDAARAAAAAASSSHQDGEDEGGEGGTSPTRLPMAVPGTTHVEEDEEDEEDEDEDEDEDEGEGGADYQQEEGEGLLGKDGEDQVDQDNNREE